MSIIQVSISIFVLSFLFYWSKIRVHVPKGYKLPPGPPRRFLIGNLFDIPLQKEWRTYFTWSKVYGDLTYLNIFGTSILYVNSYKMVSEIFEQRGGIYSDRFKSTTLVDLAGFNWSVATMQPNEKWRQHRSILNQLLSKTSMMQYHGPLEKLSKSLLFRLHKTPEMFLHHTRHTIGALIMEITYGIKTLPENDPYIELAERTMKLLGEVAAPSACLADVIPILKHVPAWVPGAGFIKKAKLLNEEFNAMITVALTAVKDAMRAGNVSPSIVGTFFEEIESKGLSATTEEEETIRAVAGIMYVAAIDTTESVLQVFFVAMLLYPDVQKKAQAELDNVLGEDRSPSFIDRKKLPYIEAIIKEALRWHSVTPAAFPHLLREDDIIGEYFIPKGTIIMGNAWSLLHSKSTYGDDADDFNPDRFMDPQTKYPDSAFGFGRRICPGRHMADSMLFILIANILHTFDIVPYETSTGGKELPSPDAFVSGLISRPMPFKCRFIPRSPRTKVFLDELAGFE